MFSIASDLTRKLIEIRYEGFPDAETVAASFAEEQRIAAAMGCRSLDHLLLVDARALAVLSQEVVGDLLRSLASRAIHARRGAVVTGGALSSLQLKRVISRERNVQMFTALEPAMSWLLADGEA